MHATTSESIFRYIIDIEHGKRVGKTPRAEKDVTAGAFSAEHFKTKAGV